MLYFSGRQTPFVASQLLFFPTWPSAQLLVPAQLVSRHTPAASAPYTHFLSGQVPFLATHIIIDVAYILCSKYLPCQPQLYAEFLTAHFVGDLLLGLSAC